MIDLLQNYSTILSFLRLDKVTGSKVKTVLGLIGIQVSEEVADIVASMLQEAGERGEAKTLADVMKNDKLMSEISSLVSAMTAENTTRDTQKGIILSVESVVNCPHCQGAFALNDSPGVKRHLLGNEAVQSIK